MALTKVNRGGLNTGVSDSSNATFLTVDSSEQAVIKSEGGAVTTSVQQGLAKAWCAYDGSGTVAIADSFNISDMTDTANGSYTITINSDMSNTTYSSQSCGDQTGGSTSTCITNQNSSVTAITVVCRKDGTVTDNDDMYLTVHGDLA